ncbi:tRNA threonylcarbamoyladenosine dehydratase [Candidatus Kinetoplastibacterium sorsogonicusi]|uniref:tRNA threonylcarbamoyladenosine dehydratase n=1 Tax=Candidatus Kinetoplastidibacterium kentomonadis TaxID=1576550 RepID=A0A3S7JAE3_9PROT|nr:tRNA threonylcarbamoyladenosine dehydratase [Candidatus Kinetoplastibacterium sorsogonicusi]AWD32639.1 tRNA threonylcarbamoyladenosine dehydratase [Candidatus Kinetoplastibacterium sorsogonicusi]
MLSKNIINYDRLFSGTYRLYGNNAKNILQTLNIVVVGIGGVGSWVVESLVRSGVLNITIIDMDHISESNINRQIHATIPNLGKSKVYAMKERAQHINPNCIINCIEDFLLENNIDEILSKIKFHFLIDCTDNIKAKIAMILYAKKHNKFILSCGAAGGKDNPLLIKYSDLCYSQNDALLSKLRYELRKNFNFPKHFKKNIIRKKMNIPVIWVDQVAKIKDCNIMKKDKIIGGLSCHGYGSIITVTASMGFIAAGIILNKALLD